MGNCDAFEKQRDDASEAMATAQDAIDKADREISRAAWDEAAAVTACALCLSLAELPPAAGACIATAASAIKIADDEREQGKADKATAQRHYNEAWKQYKQADRALRHCQSSQYV